MRALGLILLALTFAPSVMAFSIFDLPASVQTILGNAGSIQLESRTYRGIPQPSSRKECKKDYQKKVAKLKEKGQVLHSAAYIIGTFRKSQLKNSSGPSSKKMHFLGLKDGNYPVVNSWSPSTTPHYVTRCEQEWKVEKSFIKMHEAKLCRVVKMGLDELSYNMVFCEGENNIYADHDGIMGSVEIDCVNCI